MAEDSGDAAGAGGETGTTEQLIRALLDPDRYPHAAADSIELIETHISWVLLTGSFAYKLKKPLELPFVDFSTLERRRHFCEEELRLNRRLAPELYLDVVPIGGSPDAPVVGAEPAIEYAVKLKQFDAAATADRQLAAGAVSSDAIADLATLIARFHLSQPAAASAPIARLAESNIDELDANLAQAGYRFPLDELRAWTREQCRALGSRFAEREQHGAVRDAHGDLHLENVVVIDGRLRPFDALEFDPAMRAVDVVDEAAFLVMDLIAHGRADFASLFLNTYLELTGDYRGTSLLRFYVVYRALVRAKVRALKAAQGHAAPRASDGDGDGDGVQPYLRLARAAIEPAQPLLLLTRGLSASGKTTIASELMIRLPALRLRSDLERKRLAGVDADAQERLDVGAGRYDAASTQHTYDRLLDLAGCGLEGGLNVIVDATFLSRARRQPFAELAERFGVRYAILDCTAPEPMLRRRIAERAAARSDASEATEAVLDAQLNAAEPLSDSEAALAHRVDTSQDVDYDALCRALRP